MSRAIPKSYGSTFRQTVNGTHVDADLSAFVEETLRQKIEDGDLVVGSQDLIAEFRRTLVSQADGM